MNVLFSMGFILLINLFDGMTPKMETEYVIANMQYNPFGIEKIANLPDSAFYVLPIQERIIRPETGAYWLKFVIHNTSKKALYLWSFQYDKVVFYYPNEKNGYDSAWYESKAGYGRPILYKDPVFSIPYTNQPQIYYAKIYCNRALGLGFYIEKDDFVLNQVAVISTFYSLYIGGILFVLTFCIVWWIRLRFKIYFYYALYLLFLLLYTLTTSGYIPLFQFISIKGFFPECIPYAGITISLLLYTREFLNTPSQFPKVDAIIVCCAIARVLILLVGIFLSNNDFHNALVDSVFLFPALAVAIWAAKDNIKFARFFMLSILVIFIAALYHATLEKYIEGDKYFIPGAWSLFFSEWVYVFLIASIVEVGFFTMALAERFLDMQHQVRKEHKLAMRAQQELLEQALENEALKDEMNQSLEKQVAERTHELSLANEQLSKQALEISYMNELLKDDNIKLTHNVEILQKARVMDENVTFIEFCQLFPSEEASMAFVSDVKWKKGYTCKKCGYKKYYAGLQPFSKKCKSCGYDESPTAHTLFDSVKFPLQKALYLTFMIFCNKNFHIPNIAPDIGLRPATCYAFHNKVKNAIQSKKDVESWVGLIS